MKEMMKRVYTGYLRTDESTDKTMMVVFVYKRRYKKFRMQNSPKVKVTIEYLTTT